MRRIVVACCAVWFCLAQGLAVEPTAKPKLKLAADGFPAGHETPEGAACDLMRAFIKQDAALFTEACIKPFGGGENKKEYEEFLGNVAESLKLGAAAKEPSPYGSKSIAKVFAARHLSKAGSASYGYAAFGFDDVMFVDAEVLLQDGERTPKRTLVLKKSGRWYADPALQLSPLLSTGLDDETASSQGLMETYDLEP